MGLRPDADESGGRFFVTSFLNSFIRRFIRESLADILPKQCRFFFKHFI
jgi:hypothetical protein